MSGTRKYRIKWGSPWICYVCGEILLNDGSCKCERNKDKELSKNRDLIIDSILDKKWWQFWKQYN